jgi:hypothetical protein
LINGCLHHQTLQQLQDSRTAMDPPAIQHGHATSCSCPIRLWFDAVLVVIFCQPGSAQPVRRRGCCWSVAKPLAGASCSSQDTTPKGAWLPSQESQIKLDVWHAARAGSTAAYRWMAQWPSCCNTVATGATLQRRNCWLCHPAGLDIHR